jgi:GTP-binding protein
VERTRLLVHVLDCSGLSGRDPWDDFQVLNRELAAYSDRLAQLPQIVALNKVDMPGAGPIVAVLRPRLEALGLEARELSGLTGAGTDDLGYTLARRLEELPPPAPAAAPEEVRFTARDNDDAWDVERAGDGSFVVRGKGIERLVAMTDQENDAALRRMQRILDRLGVVRRLRDLGAAEGDTVHIGVSEFEFLD